jgi:phosphoglycerate dehydrogenase-like enzyme
MDRPLVIQTEHLDPEPAAWLGERCELVRCGSEEGRFAGLLERAAGLVIRTYTAVDEAMLAAAPRLKVVGRAGVGVDNVDLEACARRGVAVVNTPDANTRAVVEYVTGLMCEAVRPRMFLREAVGLGRWKELREAAIAPRQLDEMTLGIYGLGKIGSKVARVGAALNMRVVYRDLREVPVEERNGAEPVTREELLAQADVLTVHVDGRPSNRGLLGAEAIGRMKKDVVFINTSRGFVVDAGALAGFLKRNAGARAILDVHEPEPFGAEYPLLGLSNAWLAPHLASATVAAKRNMSWVVRDVWRVLSGEAPLFPATALP